MAETRRPSPSGWPRPWPRSSGSTGCRCDCGPGTAPTAGPDDAPLVVIRSPQAIRRLVWAPGRAGAGPRLRRRRTRRRGRPVRAVRRAELDRPAGAGRVPRPVPSPSGWRCCAPAWRSASSDASRAPPPEEVRLRRYGRLHSRRRDAAAIAHHYDVGNDFYRLVLGPSMVYSCAVWDGRDRRPGGRAGGQARPGLPQARAAARVSGCSTSAAAGAAWRCTPRSAYGADVVGITLSQEQAMLARKRVAEAGLTGSDRDPGAGLPRRRRRAVRRDQLGRHGRARRAGEAARLRRHPRRAAAARAAGCSTTPSPGPRRRPPGTTTPSSPATSSPTASWSASATWSTP